MTIVAREEQIPDGAEGSPKVARPQTAQEFFSKFPECRGNVCAEPHEESPFAAKSRRTQEVLARRARRVEERVETARGFHRRRWGNDENFDELSERAKAENAEILSDIDAGIIESEQLPLVELRRTNYLLEQILNRLNRTYR